MKKVELLFANIYELCLFKRSSETKNCQMDFDHKRLRGDFPQSEINLAVNVFGAVATESMNARTAIDGRNQSSLTNI